MTAERHLNKRVFDVYVELKFVSLVREIHSKNESIMRL
jgi:hypothetical protein